MTRKRNVSETAPGSAAAPARAKKGSTTIHSRRTKATEAELATPAPAVEAAPQAAELEPATMQGRAPEITHEQIARLAYSYWEARGSQGGSPEDDWARAELELRAQA
jgi:hypothetical protein